MNIPSQLAAYLGKSYRGAITLLAVVGIWAALSRLHLVSVQLLPAPETILRTFQENAASGLLGTSLRASLVRIAQGFLIGCSLGFVLGALMGVSLAMERLFAPLVDALRQVPIVGWIPLIIVWCGIADLSKITFIAIGAFFPMVVNTFEAIRSVPRGYLEVARVFEFGKWKLLSRVVIPGALPGIVTGIRLSLGSSWMLVVWSEINTRSDPGIGEMLDCARETSRMDLVIVCIIVIGAIAWAINELLGQLERQLQGWKKSVR